ncbi:MAG: crossover junction endodeoxyribonuclease RuvC, partial [Planctomycetota bacterium]|nr:crossover junction endodeoxyribonuclease RuvC [Planctomycetota bacterium]
MILVGIDPGLNLTGYACVEVTTGDPEPRLLEAGVIRMTRGESMPARLGHLFEQLEAVFEEFAPGKVVVESIFSHRSFQKAGLLMGHARG